MTDDKKQVRVLLTGGGGAGTIEIIKRLRETGRYYVIAADAARYSGGFAYADKGYVVPLGASAEFESAMRELIERERPRFVVPLVDEEIPIVHDLVDREFSDIVRIVAPRPEFCHLALDKWSTYRSLAAAELPTAHTWLASDAEHCRYPAVIKLRHGRGSRGLAYLTNEQELAEYLERASEKAERYVVQERLTGVEYTTSVVVGLGGPLFAVVPKEVTDKRGITHVGVTREVVEIDRLGREIQERLRADGPFNVQLIMGEDRVPRVIEINPRYSTTVALTLGAGLDEVDAVLRHADGLDPGPLTYRPGVMMIRHYDQVFVDEVEWNRIGELP